MNMPMSHPGSRPSSGTRSSPAATTGPGSITAPTTAATTLPPADIPAASLVHEMCWEQGKWTKRTLKEPDAIRNLTTKTPGVKILFLGRVEEASSEVKDAVSDSLGVPSFFWDRCGWDANGFFKPYKRLSTQNDGTCDLATISRFLIKEILPVTAQNSVQQFQDRGYTYNWQYLAFATLAPNNPDKSDYEAPSINQQLVCFDLSDELRARIQTAFEDSDVPDWIGCPYGFYAVLFSVIARYFDQALWGFRSPLRELEQHRILEFDQEDLVTSRYLSMHEISRHVLHEIETLEISARTMRVIDDCHSKNCKWDPAGEQGDADARRREARRSFCSSEISFYPQFLENLGVRAHTFEDRLKTEIRLAFHLAGADDNKTARKVLDKNKEIAQNSQNDGRELTRLVSTATLLFLPGSFCSSVFGMNFFNYGDNAVSVSAQIWIFFLVTTITTIGAFFFWHWYEKRNKTEQERKRRLVHGQRRGQEKDDEESVIGNRASKIERVITRRPTFVPPMSSTVS